MCICWRTRSHSWESYPGKYHRIYHVRVYAYLAIDGTWLDNVTNPTGGGIAGGPLWSPFNDPAAVTRYTQTYRYDRAGNLLELTHEGAQKHGHRLLAAAQSNRCLPVLNDVEPDEEDFRNGFDANGNLLALQPGQSLHWDLRNQLREVRPVERDNAADDSEQYRYGADGMRLRIPLAELVGAYETAEDALRGTDWREVDVLLTDLDLPGLSKESLCKFVC